MSPRLRFSILARDHFTCRYCGRKAPTVELHVDHVFPTSAGGEDTPDNLVTACQDCNLGKRADILPGAVPESVETARSSHWWTWSEEPLLRKYWVGQFTQESRPYWDDSDVRWWLWTIGPYIVRREVEFAADHGRCSAVGSRKAFTLLRRRCDDVATPLVDAGRYMSEITNEETYLFFHRGGEAPFDVSRLARRHHRLGLIVDRKDIAAQRQSRYLPGAAL